MDKLNWDECNWENNSEANRPTENDAISSIRMQVRIMATVSKSKKEVTLAKSVLSHERRYMMGGDDNEVAIMKISKKFSISETKVKNILKFCTILAYYDEITY